MGTHSLSEMVVGVVLLSLLISAGLSNELEEEDDEVMIDPRYNRQVRFSFGLGKRSSPPLRPDVARLLATIKAWGYSGPHGLFKRAKDPSEEDPNEDILELLEEVEAKLMHMGQKSKRITDEEMGKRQPYGFGLGKRSAPSYDFGLGKRDLNNYDPEPAKMKRQSWLRKRFSLGSENEPRMAFDLGSKVTQRLEAANSA